MIEPPPALSRPLREALAHAAERIGVQEIDRVWVFPPRTLGQRLSHLLVLSATAESDERRTVYTVRVEVEESRRGPRVKEQVQEEGTAPLESVEGVIAGVLRRLDAAGGEPVEHEIGGSREAWEALCGAGDAAPAGGGGRGLPVDGRAGAGADAARSEGAAGREGVDPIRQE